jgi:hypothetical protein
MEEKAPKVGPCQTPRGDPSPIKKKIARRVSERKEEEQAAQKKKRCRLHT